MLLGTRLPPLVATNIVLLDDATHITIPYAAHAVPTTGRARRARRPKMHPPTPNPTETSLGMLNEREDLLEQVARKSRVARWGRAIARVTVVFSVLVLAVFLFGPL